MTDATSEPLAPVLLGDASWWGTLAAARALGSRGVPVTLASDRWLAPARWSRWVRRTVPCPPTRDAAALLGWLLRFGDRHPGHVLYPTSDEVAWLVACHRVELAARYRLYVPSPRALLGLLDKGSLSSSAEAAGLDVPRCWLPADEGELPGIARAASFPLLVKPRAPLFGRSGEKGVTVADARGLQAAWQEMRARGPAELPAWARAAALPMVQASVPHGERIYTVDGFVDETGELFATRACVKVLQVPRGRGPGVIFEAAPVDPAAAGGLRRLFRRAGFHGVFDVEFLEHGGRKLLIDVNPRFYNHMAFEVDRGMDLPWMAYAAARGDRVRLRQAVQAADASAAGPASYLHRFPARLLLAAQRLGGAMAPEDRRRWARWMAAHRASASDPAWRPDDRGPARLEVLAEALALLRHPRSTLRRFLAAGEGPGDGAAIGGPAGRRRAEDPDHLPDTGS